MEKAFKLLLSCPSGLSRSQLSVNLNESFDRIPHPATDLEISISEIWDQRVQKSTSLFNGKKFRYGGLIVYGESDSNQGSHVCLQLGLTDYRTFVGTNLNPLWERFLVPLEDDIRQCQHTSSPLGNGAVVETSDSKILVLQRSHNVGEFPGYLVFPGGHPEPQEVGITSHHDHDLKNLYNNRKVSEEMFNSIIREVVEEIGVSAATLCDPVFIGISRRVLNVRPAAFFFIKCNLQSEEIQQVYSTAQDSFESTRLYALPMRKGRPWCDHCKRPGRTRETCWKIHGKPTDWKHSRAQNDQDIRANIATTSDNNNNTEISSFTKEQIEALQKLLGHVSIPSQSTSSSVEQHTSLVAHQGIFPYAFTVQVTKSRLDSEFRIT